MLKITKALFWKKKISGLVQIIKYINVKIVIYLESLLDKIIENFFRAGHSETPGTLNYAFPIFLVSLVL